MSFHSVDYLKIEPETEITRIVDYMRRVLTYDLKRRGVIVGLSGGIDSSVVAALSVKAFGSKRVFGLLMPEKESDDDSLRLGKAIAQKLQIDYQIEEITAPLTALGCYDRRDTAIRRVEPHYGADWQSKLTIKKNPEGEFHYHSLTLRDPEGMSAEYFLAKDAYAALVAASNYKQRVRKTVEYYHADRLHYAVCGTPNKLEYDQGFFVKQGDGAADLKPIAHLYKSQVYQLAEKLEIPSEICLRPPTTDTYSLTQSQEEFFFSLPLWKLDACLFAMENNISLGTVAEQTSLSEEEILRVYADIAVKRRSTHYLHLPPFVLPNSDLSKKEEYGAGNLTR